MQYVLTYVVSIENPYVYLHSGLETFVVLKPSAAYPNGISLRKTAIEVWVWLEYL